MFATMDITRRLLGVWNGLFVFLSYVSFLSYLSPFTPLCVFHLLSFAACHVLPASS
jgi:hypothetical protein